MHADCGFSVFVMEIKYFVMGDFRMKTQKLDDVLRKKKHAQHRLGIFQYMHFKTYPKPN